MSEPADLLDVRGLVVSYGTVEAVRGIDLRVGDGEAVALLGANGAGKSSTLPRPVRVCSVRGERSTSPRRTSDGRLPTPSLGSA